mmetsp:Transcript_54240/g.137813  ORF Transcript_54240/g.137813 Transcript_54240/m.137813 type:complete len:225 (+) Transcript_54240:33-707(+)
MQQSTPTAMTMINSIQAAALWSELGCAQPWRLTGTGYSRRAQSRSNGTRCSCHRQDSPGPPSSKSGPKCTSDPADGQTRRGRHLRQRRPPSGTLERRPSRCRPTSPAHPRTHPACKLPRRASGSRSPSGSARARTAPRTLPARPQCRGRRQSPLSHSRHRPCACSRRGWCESRERPRPSGPPRATSWDSRGYQDGPRANETCSPCRPPQPCHTAHPARPPACAL